MSSFTGASDDIAQEQSYVSMLYDRVDTMREQASDRLTRWLRETGGTHQARSERDTAIELYTRQLAQFSAVENGLCFGRLDLEAPEQAHQQAHQQAPEQAHEQASGRAPERRYIGRIGLFDDDGDYEPLLMDWRAPAARPFYLATAVSPEGVRRRRHIRTVGRTVVGLDDEVLDLAAARTSRHEEVTGEAALLAAVTAGRTGRMRDIVATIQGEQDRIIRSQLHGVLVVQGGPGTGKTAVALHRAAYLLYTHRRELETRGVLIVGPNPTFLQYISQVLPSLAETGVLLGTLGDLYPAVTARRGESPAVTELKGRPVMAEILAAAVRDRQEIPDEPLEITVDQQTLVLDRWTCIEARTRTRRADKPHNLARPLFDTEIIHALSEQLAERIGVDVYADDPLGGDDAPGDPYLLQEADLAEIRRELREDPAVRAALDRLWPILTPQQLLTDLFGSAERLATAAPLLSDAEWGLLLRAPGGDWAPADVPLLDEAAELLGEDDRAAHLAEQRRRWLHREYAEGALEILAGSRSIDVEDEDDPEILLATDLIDAGQLGERQQGGDRRTAAERAAADRRWAFGHVIVDEAQELSPMAWRLLMRRCPSRSMTLVGDVAQTGELAGASSWHEVLEPYVGDRWRLEELTVNYRTPAEIMTVAADVLAGVGPDLVAPRSVRETGMPPWAVRIDPERCAEQLVPLVLGELAEITEGRVGVLVPAGRLTDLGSAVTAAVPEAGMGDDAELERRVVVLTVRQAKGLEFDSVLVIDPESIVAESPRGHGDLYVALTRATQRLGLVLTGGLPTALRRVQVRDTVGAERAMP